MGPQLPRRGTIGDRPWGVTLGRLARSRATCQLTLTAEDGKRYCLAFVSGAVVGASSPLASDAVARIALTSHLVSSSQVPALARAVAAAPDRDEVAVVAEAARLQPEQADQLRRRLLVQRAARTFSVDRGAYELDEHITVPSAPGVEVELAPAIFLGVRMNLSQERLAEDLRQLGAQFVLREDAVDAAQLARLGLGEEARPIVEALRLGTSLPELEARYRELEPRLTQAVIYALVAAGLCEGLGGRAPSRDVAREAAAAAAPAGPAVAGARTTSRDVSAAAARAQAQVRAGSEQPEVARARTITAEVARARTTTAETARARSPSVAPVLPPRPRTPSSAPGTAPRLSSVFAAREVIAAGIAKLDVRADHFALLGVPRDASIDAIRSAYVALACHLHPDKLPELDPAATRDAQRLFAHVNLAFGVLTDPVRRADYLATLERSAPPAAGAGAGAAAGAGAGASRAGTAAERARAAAEIAQRGMQALRREDMVAALEQLTRATELAPTDVDIAAMLAWARFCASTDKTAIAPEVRRVLERAVFKSQKPVMARFYLGRVERMLGRVREALHHFHEVIELDPNHADAAAEIRLLEPRVARR